MKEYTLRFKVKKLISCMLAVILIMLSCDNGLNVQAADAAAYAVGDTFTEDILKYRVIDEDNKYVEVAGENITEGHFSGRLDIPSEITHNGITYSVKRIGDRAFYNYEQISRVYIPDSVTEIGKEAFYTCDLLYYVDIPDGVKVIGDNAFWTCNNLKNVNIPESVEKIGNQAFMNCMQITEVKIPEGVKEIGSEAFALLQNVKEISLPSTLSKMGDKAFMGCGLNEKVSTITVTIKEGVEEIGANAFANCQKIKEITIPASVKNIGEQAFFGCTGLEEAIIIKGENTEISKGCFSGCKSLKYIEIPDSITSIEASAFMDCSSLESITIPASVTSFSASRTFESCRSLSEMRIAVEDKEGLVNPIFIANDSTNPLIFNGVPADRKLVFLTADGTKKLTGTSLEAAQNAYIAAEDGDTTDNYWFGWQIVTAADLYTVDINVEKDGEQWDSHGKKFFLKNESGYLTDDFLAESGTYTVCVGLGTNFIDTGVTVLVEDRDTSVTIEYFTVTFYDGDVAYGNDTAWGQQIVRKGDYAVNPASEPVKDGFKFAGWKTDKEGSKAFNFGAGITEKTDIYASWIEDSESPTTPSETTEQETSENQNEPTEQETSETPSEPTEQETSETPSKPTETEATTTPNEPTELETPSIPAVPSNPAETETTTEPNNPAESETTTTTTEPSNPVESEPTTTSSSPANTEPTTEPNKPINSGTPSNPNEFSEIEETGTTAPVGEAQKGEKPKTGDTTHVEIYATAAMIAGLSYVMLMFARRKEGMSEEEKNLRVSALIEWSKKGSRIRKYVAFTVIIFILLYYHSIGKRLDLEWKEICGD